MSAESLVTLPQGDAHRGLALGHVGMPRWRRREASQRVAVTPIVADIGGAAGGVGSGIAKCVGRRVTLRRASPVWVNDNATGDLETL